MLTPGCGWWAQEGEADLSKAKRTWQLPEPEQVTNGVIWGHLWKGSEGQKTI
jgi:hypothetical protein